MYNYIIRIATEEDHVTATCDELYIEITADTINNAIDAIKDAIEQEVATKITGGQTVEEPTIELSDGEYILSCDVESRVKEISSEMVRRTISLPLWLDTKIKNSDVDSSKLFREAAISALMDPSDKISTIKELEANVDENLLKKYVQTQLTRLIYKEEKL